MTTASKLSTPRLSPESDSLCPYFDQAAKSDEKFAIHRIGFLSQIRIARRQIVNWLCPV